MMFSFVFFYIMLYLLWCIGEGMTATVRIVCRLWYGLYDVRGTHCTTAVARSLLNRKTGAILL